MTDDLNPAITKLEQALADVERKANGLRDAINLLCEQAGLPPRYSASTGVDGGPKITSIKPDTFYGKKQQTAIREYLEMRKRAGDGPATPRQIFDALKDGGYQFEAKQDDVALIGLRALMRKRTNFFHKLPNGSYGLTSWYENIKAAKTHVEADDDAGDEEGEE
jgi:hypothetical protein